MKVMREGWPAKRAASLPSVPRLSLGVRSGVRSCLSAARLGSKPATRYIVGEG